MKKRSVGQNVFLFYTYEPFHDHLRSIEDFEPRSVNDPSTKVPCSIVDSPLYCTSFPKVAAVLSSEV